MHLSHTIVRPRPLAEYLKAQGKYKHLSPEQIAHIQKSLDENVEFIRGLVAGGTARRGIAPPQIEAAGRGRA